MNKEILKKAWVLALLLLVIAEALGIFLLTISRILGVKNYGLSGIAGMAGAVLIGQIYTANFKEVMCTKLRWTVIIFFTLPQVLIKGLYILMTKTTHYPISISILMAIGIIIYSLMIYHLLGFSGRIYLKALQKREANG